MHHKIDIIRACIPILDCILTAQIALVTYYRGKEPKRVVPMNILRIKECILYCFFWYTLHNIFSLIVDTM